MIYFFFGTDTKKARTQAHKFIDSLLLKKPNASFFSVDSESFDQQKATELIESRGLFEEKYIIFLDGVCEDKNSEITLLDNVKNMASSQHIFIIMESKQNKSVFKKVEKLSEKKYEYNNAIKQKNEKFNIFTLTDSFGKRDKKKMWTILTCALRAGVSPEEINGVLIWQIKSILLAVSSQTASTSGLSPFVYSKAVNFSKNFTEKELKNMYSNLVTIYHDSRRGIVEFEIELECFVLKMI